MPIDAEDRRDKGRKERCQHADRQIGNHSPNDQANNCDQKKEKNCLKVSHTGEKLSGHRAYGEAWVRAAFAMEWRTDRHSAVSNQPSQFPANPPAPHRAA